MKVVVIFVDFSHDIFDDPLRTWIWIDSRFTWERLFELLNRYFAIFVGIDHLEYDFDIFLIENGFMINGCLAGLKFLLAYL